MSAWLTGLVFGIFGVVFIVIPVVVLVAQYARTRSQRVILEHGTLSVADGVTATTRDLSVEQIGTVVYLPERDRLPATRRGSNGIWTWGGILILDAAGHLVRRITHIPGSGLALRPIYEQIPAPVRDEIDTYSRGAFLKKYPHALRFGQLWGGTRWAMVITLAIIVGIPVLAVIAAVIAAVLSAAL